MATPHPTAKLYITGVAGASVNQLAEKIKAAKKSTKSILHLEVFIRSNKDQRGKLCTNNSWRVSNNDDFPSTAPGDLSTVAVLFNVGAYKPSKFRTLSTGIGEEPSAIIDLLEQEVLRHFVRVHWLVITGSPGANLHNELKNDVKLAAEVAFPGDSHAQEAIANRASAIRASSSADLRTPSFRTPLKQLSELLRNVGPLRLFSLLIVVLAIAVVASSWIFIPLSILIAGAALTAVLVTKQGSKDRTGFQRRAHAWCEANMFRSDAHDEAPEPEQRSFSHVSTATEFTVLVNPTVQQLDDELAEFFARSSDTTVHLWFCGHGSSSGAWQLQDWPLLAEDFKNMLITHMTQPNTRVPGAVVNVFINSCFGYQFGLYACGLDHLLDRTDGSTATRWDRYTNTLDAHTPNDIYRVLQRGLANEHDNVFRLAQSMFSVDALKVDARGKKNVCGGKIVFLPFSNEPLVASGVLVASGAADDDETRERLLAPVAANPMQFLQQRDDFSKVTVTQHDVTDHPVVVLHRAAYGGCTLLRFRDIAILVDGGRYFSSGVCYYDSIKDLPYLDLVTLTHGDMDHVGGLAPLMCAVADQPKKYAAAGLPEVLNTVSLGTSRSDARGWWDGRLFHDSAEKADRPTDGPIVQRWRGEIHSFALESTDSELVATVKIISPTGKLYKKALRKADKARGTLINKASVVLIVTFTVQRHSSSSSSNSSKVFRFLFTGDSDGDIVAAALKESGDDNILFDYADIPHHGSDDSEPKAYLDTVKSKRFGLSTDGAIYNHPDEKTVKFLLQKMDAPSGSASTAYFTHTHPEKQRHKTKVSSVANANGIARSVLKRCFFADEAATDSQGLRIDIT